MNNKSNLAPVSSTGSPIPGQLQPVIYELNKVSNLTEFLFLSLMRVQDDEDGEISLSYGESSALVNLMQTVTERINHATGTLDDLKLGMEKEEASHE